MWKKEHKTIVAGVTAEQVWRVWTDIKHWPTWDSSLISCSWITPHTEFKSGSVFKLKPKGGPAVKITLSEVVPLQKFSDYTQFFLARMYDIHELRVVPNGLEITNTITISGPLAWLWRKLVAENVAKSIAEQTENLIARAKTK